MAPDFCHMGQKNLENRNFVIADLRFIWDLLVLEPCRYQTYLPKQPLLRAVVRYDLAKFVAFPVPILNPCVQGAPMVQFRAGKMERKGTKVVADPRKGWLQLQMVRY